MNKFLEARVKRKYYNKIQKKSFYKLLKSGFLIFFLQRFYRKEILKAKKPEKQDNVFD